MLVALVLCLVLALAFGGVFVHLLWIAAVVALIVWVVLVISGRRGRV